MLFPTFNLTFTECKYSLKYVPVRSAKLDQNVNSMYNVICSQHHDP